MRRTPSAANGLILILPLMLVTGFTVDAAELSSLPVWQETFDEGISAARTYFRDGKTAALEATDCGTIRATLPGERTLEGFRVTATGLPANRRVAVKASVRGQGDLLLALNSRNGWLYAPVHSLEDKWQLLEVDKATGPDDTTLTICFISSGKRQPGAIFEVDNVQVFVAAPLEVDDVEVGPRKFEAEAFAGSPDAIVAEETASAGQLVSAERSLRLDGIPFPRTSRLVSVCVRAKTGAKRSRLSLISKRCGRDQTIRSVELAPSQDWSWHCIRSVSAEEIGDTMSFVGRVDEAGASPLVVDCLVLCSDLQTDDAMLDSVRVAASTELTVRVVKTSVAPVIDGKPGDACWKGAVAVGDFLTYNAFTPLAEPTNVRFLHDATHLYVLMEAQEPVLEVAAQRRHEIIAKATERNGKVLRDDSGMVLLSPEGSEEGYEFSVNTLGTLVDARCEMSDLRNTRDVSWNSDVDVAARQEDGYWVAELAIPLADLGVTSSVEGQRWQAIVARIAKSRGEMGTWNHSLNGAHAPVTTGTLLFGEPSVGLIPAKPLRTLEAGLNALDVTLHPVGKEAFNAGVYIWSRVECPGKPIVRGVSYVPPRVEKASHPIEVEHSGPVTVNWGAMDASTLEPLCVSPTIHTSVQSSRATLTLTTDEAYRVVVNDRTVANGIGADRTALQLPLSQGENVIAVEVASGLASLELAGPSEIRTPVRWRINEANTKDAFSARLDDREWELAAPVNETSNGREMLGWAGRPAVFRHTLLLGHTRIWPKPLPAIYVAGNGMEDINFTAMGLAGKKQVNWQLLIAVPDGYEVLGATGYYGKYVKTQPLFEWEPVGEVAIDGERLQLHRVRATKPLVANRHQIMSLFQLMVRIADPKTTPTGSSSTWYYWTCANDGSMTEPRLSFTVEALPALAGKQPEEFAMQLWGGIHRMDADELREPLLATIEAAGFNEFVTSDRWSSDHADKFGLRTQLLLSFQSWSIDLTEHLKAHPDDRLIDRHGKPSRVFMCTSRLLGSGWALADDRIVRCLEERRPDIAQYDYEYPPMTGPHSCFCARCLGAFREYSKPPVEVVLTPELIQADYADEWVDFMARRVTQLLGKVQTSVHSARPGTKFSVYSGYHLPDNAARYGIDWEYIGEAKATDIIGCGYGRPLPAIHDTLEAADGIPTIFGVLLTPYRPALDQPVTWPSKARILRRAIDATGGVLIYSRRSMDGRWWYAVAEVSRLIASFEDLFLHKRPLAVDGQDQAAVQLLRGKTASLLCVMNNSSKPRKSTLTLPAELGDATEFYSQETLRKGETVSLQLPPGEVAVYVFRDVDN